MQRREAMMQLFESLRERFRRSPKPAALAKQRLSVIVARERASTRGAPDYLPQLQQELLSVLAKYERVDLDNVSVKLDRSGDCDVLELNILLPPEPARLRGQAGAASAQSGRIGFPV